MDCFCFCAEPRGPILRRLFDFPEYAHGERSFLIPRTDTMGSTLLLRDPRLPRLKPDYVPSMGGCRNRVCYTFWLFASLAMSRYWSISPLSFRPCDLQKVPGNMHRLCPPRLSRASLQHLGASDNRIRNFVNLHHCMREEDTQLHHWTSAIMSRT